MLVTWSIFRLGLVRWSMVKEARLGAAVAGQVGLLAASWWGAARLESVGLRLGVLGCGTVFSLLIGLRARDVRNVDRRIAHAYAAASEYLDGRS